jgi:hypothetical protein
MKVLGRTWNRWLKGEYKNRLNQGQDFHSSKKYKKKVKIRFTGRAVDQRRATIRSLILESNINHSTTQR